MMLLTLQSCIEEYNAVLPADDVNLLVVEGTIISGETSGFLLSRTVPLTGDKAPEGVRTARLFIKGSDGLDLFVPRVYDNVYAVEVPKLNPEAEYSLHIEYDGEMYNTVPQKPLPSTPIESVTYSQPKANGDVNILVTTAMPKDPEETQYYRWFYDETWEIHAQYRTVVQWDEMEKKGVPLEKEYVTVGWCTNTGRDIIASSSAYYNDNKIAEYKLYGISSDSRRFQVLYSTEVTQLSISKAEYEYEVERRRISQDMGGLFTPQPSVLPSNIHCTTSSKRAIGYVGCSAGYARKRIFISPKDVNCHPDIYCQAYYSDEDDFPGNENLYQSGWKLIQYIEPPVITGWAPFTCVDVSNIADLKVRPDYWPTEK